jgi:hypothetical protein
MDAQYLTGNVYLKKATGILGFGLTLKIIAVVHVLTLHWKKHTHMSMAVLIVLTTDH